MKGLPLSCYRAMASGRREFRTDKIDRTASAYPAYLSSRAFPPALRRDSATAGDSEQFDSPRLRDGKRAVGLVNEYRPAILQDDLRVGVRLDLRGRGREREDARIASGSAYLNAAGYRFFKVKVRMKE